MITPNYTKYTAVLAFCLMYLSPTIQAQDPVPLGDPFAATPLPYVPSEIQIYTEIIKISALEYAKIMTKSSTSSNHTALRNKLFEQVKAGKAKLVTNQSLLTRSGEKATSESVIEYIYPAEYAFGNCLPMQPGSQNVLSLPPPSPFPPTATAYETINLGTTLHVGAIIAEDKKTIALTLAPQIVKHVGDNLHLEWISDFAKIKQQHPIFYTMRMNTSFTVIDGEFTLAGTFSPETDGKPDNSRKLLVFVKANILNVGK